MFKTKAIRIVQNGRVFYVTAIPAKILVELSKVDVWQQGEENPGYQRAPSEARKREIGRYLMDRNAVLPVGGLVNARPPDENKSSQYGRVLEFIPDDDKMPISTGELRIPTEAEPLYIVDMQHRLGGIEWAYQQPGNESLQDYPMVVTIADGLSKLEEVDQFDLINTKQKKIRTDLARRLKAIQMKDLDHKDMLQLTGKLWEARGAEIAEWLNTHNGVWYQRIMPPNKSKKDMPTAVLRETSFVESLKPIITTPFFVMKNIEFCANTINQYWEALQAIFPDAFTEPDKYVIQKTPGVFSLHGIASLVFDKARDFGGGISKETIYQVLIGLRSLEDGSYFWNSDNPDGATQYGSQKGFSILKFKLMKLLPELEVNLS